MGGFGRRCAALPFGGVGALRLARDIQQGSVKSKNHDDHKKRDRRQNRLLRANGWKVVRIWQHELTPKRRAKALRRLRRAGLGRV